MSKVSLKRSFDSTIQEILRGKIRRSKAKQDDWIAVEGLYLNQTIDLRSLKSGDLRKIPNIDEFLEIINLKASARKDEDKRVAAIVKHLNNNTPIGERLRLTYHQKFGKHIQRAEKTGTNGHHYDILIVHTDGTTRKIEEKGTATVTEITDDELPWKNSVQVFNGPGNHFSVGKKWAKHWYDSVVLTEDWENLLNVKIDPPSYEEWSKDAFRCGDPKTAFVKELKDKCRQKHGGKSSLNGKKGGKDYRQVNSTFALSDDEQTELVQEVSNVLNNILIEKEGFLQTVGTIDGEFDFRWKDQLSPPDIKDVKLRWALGSDIYFDFSTENQKDFSCIMRFGKGCGFTNIRIDIR